MTGSVTFATSPLPTTIVAGARAIDRDLAIAAALRQQPQRAGVAILLEGLADPHSPLADMDIAAPPHVQRIAPGCLCCAGNLVLRVTLNRLLRRPPEPLAHLYIGLADANHVGLLRDMLSASPYDGLLSLCDDVVAPSGAV